MFNVKTSTIRERTTNGPTYMNGRTCYRNGQVGDVLFDPEKGLIQAQVDGTQPYQVRVILNRDGAIHDTSCTCSAFTSYWGDCKHIAAVLLYCVDHFSGAKSDTGPQQSRKSRVKAREFIAQTNRRAQIYLNHNRQVLKLQVTLYCGNNPSTLPSIALAIFNGRLHPVNNLEQLLDAIARDLPIEIDESLTYDPFVHRFDTSDEPLLTLLLDAYEHDYKAAFGSATASRSEKTFVLNASRTAAFLRLAADQPRYRWTTLKGTETWPIRVSGDALPIRLLLSESTAGDGLFSLQRQPGPALLQLTASRNVYLVDDTFYLPSRESIRLLDPVLSVFSTPGLTSLTLSCDDVSDLIGLPSPVLEDICPIECAPELASRLVREPLRAQLCLSNEHDGLQADLMFHYGAWTMNPFSATTISSASATSTATATSSASATSSATVTNSTSSTFSGDSISGPAADPIIVRQRFAEQAICDLLEQSGFKRQGQAYLLSEFEAIYRFLDNGFEALNAAGVNLTDNQDHPFQILPAPDLTIDVDRNDENNELEMRINWGDLTIEDRQVYIQALRDQKPFCQSKAGRFRRVNHVHATEILAYFDLIESWGAKPTREKLMLPRYRVLSLVSLAGDFNLAGCQLTAEGLAGLDGLAEAGRSDGQPVKIAPQLVQMAADLQDPGQLTFRLPLGITVPLRPYQKLGFNWLCTLDYYGLGGILADDMGLGKTLQAIVYIAYNFRKKRKPALVIAPTSLVYNWQREFEKFAPNLPVLVIDGNRQQRSARLESIRRQACVITSYSLVRRDYPELAEISFSSCFLDEAQNIKNPETLNARSVKQIKAERTFALTGTPIENSLTELWSIFDFLLPGYLSSRRHFEALYEVPYWKDQNSGALTDLHRQIAPFILRRMKKDVLRELPDKIETRMICEMTPPQRALYDQYLANARQSFELEVAENGFAKSQLYILALLTRLRQICCHPALFLNDYKDDSGKLLLLEELIADALDGGHRILIFSQFAQMLMIIRERLAVLGHTCFLIDGQVPADERLAQVDRFNGGEGQIFLISLRAGGTGLNLTGADTVIHYDPWWNPAVEDQATDRAYRIGQENIVQVFKLYARDTLEEKIQAIQEQKQTLIEAVIKPGQNLLSQMTVDEVRSLFDT
ncbi:MAG: helicase associated domain protein [Firmicutes bacterium]|nr:helicase associated domain protein [Bacillota bacterium]